MPTGFGPFAFDRQSRLLWRDGAEIALPPRVIGVLEVLIDRPGQVVARQDLLDGVWKDAFVTDTSLAEAVSFLRQALGDDPQSPTYIQTVHRRGYRFLPPLTEVPERGLTPATPIRGLTPDQHFAVSSGARSISATVSPPVVWELLPLAAMMVCLGLAVLAIWGIGRRPAPEPPQVARFEVRATPGTAFDRRQPALAISADGRVLAWSACDEVSDACALYLRPVDRLEAVRLAGTEGGVAPFFSPDAHWIGFFADGKLKKIAATGGSPAILTDAPAPGGAAWAADGRIAFAGTPAGGLSVVSDQGGTVTTLTTPQADRGELRHLYPAWLSGGDALVFTIASSPLADASGELAVLRLTALPRGSTSPRILRAGITRAAAAGPGYLLISSAGDLQAATFDERTLTLTGGAESMLTSVTSGDGIAQFAISAGGTLVAIRSTRPGPAVWIDTHGDHDAGPIGRLTAITVSPDSRRVAGVIAEGTSADIWMADVEGGALTRVTYGGNHASPAWSADGQRLFFATRTDHAFGIASRGIADRAATAAGTRPGMHLFPSSAAADGRLAVTATLPGGRTAVGIIPAGGGPAQLAILSDGPFDEAAPAFSPDGKWLAFESGESGRTEIVLRNLADGRRVTVSTGGGTRPRWLADGRAVIFDAGRHLMRAAVTPLATPDVVFARPGSRMLAATPSGRVLAEAQTPGRDAALVVLDWLRELRQRLPLPVAAPR